jgi:hypothetical protein
MGVAKTSKLGKHEMGKHGAFARWVACTLSAVATYFGGAYPALSQSSVCAEVKIEIRQKVSLERQAFDVALKINNGLTDRAIEALRVTLLVSDLAGNAVSFTSDPNNIAAAFFYRVDSLTGTAALDGSSAVAAATQAEARWLFIPSPGAAGTLPSGKQYRIGASIDYVLAGQAQTVDVEPETITVRAQPKLTLDYFLQPDIYADDPFTVPVEPSESATLGVRVRNTGLGSATNMKIDSAQPKIVENRQGLAIAFKLEGGYVNDQSRGSSLLLDFGTIEAGATAMGRWDLTTTLAGRFVEFGATFTHADALGGALTSLLETVTTRFLLRDVIVDLPGRDAIRDFLSSDGGWFVYESNGVDTPVVDVSVNSSLSAVSGGYRLTHQTSPLLTYSRVPSPGNTNLRITNVTRSDGKVLNPQNYWVSKTRTENLTWNYFINVFDSQTTGDYLINATSGSNTMIGGRVYDDLNTNNAYDDQEPGIGVVRIDLQGVTTGGAVSSVAYTEPNGTYEFANVVPGTYRLTVGPTSARIDGAPTIGLLGGVAETVGGNAAVGNIIVGEGQQATGYLFSKRRASGSAVDVAVSLIPNKASVRIGGVASLLLVAENRSDNLAEAVSVSVSLPPFALLGTINPSVGSFDASARTWNVGMLAPRQKLQLQLPLIANQSESPPAIGQVRAAIATATLDTLSSNDEASANLRFTASAACESGSAITIEPLILIRYLNGVRGIALIEGVYDASLVTEALATIHEQNLAAHLNAYDFDGSGQATADVDGLLYARWVSGLRGNALIEGIAIAQNASLATIETALGGCQ